MKKLNLIKFVADSDNILEETPHIASDNFNAIFDLEFESFEDIKTTIADKITSYAKTGQATHKFKVDPTVASKEDRANLIQKMELPSDKTKFDINHTQIKGFIDKHNISDTEWNNIISKSMEIANA